MSTIDRHSIGPSHPDPLEADLLGVFAVQPSLDVLERLDQRIGHTLRAWAPPKPRLRLRPGRRAGVISLLAAAFLIAGANGSLKALYLLINGPFDVPWHRGVEVNLSQTVDGYTVTIDRAYADATRLALAISVVDERQRPGTTQVDAIAATVTDADGVYTSGGGAVSIPDGAFAAVNVAWKTPPVLPFPPGPRRLHVEVPFISVRDDSIPPADADEVGWNPWHRVAGPWVFDFELTVDGGTTITPNTTAVVDGIRVSVRRLIAAPGVVRVELQLDGDLPPGDWSPIGEVRHGNRVLHFVVGSLGANGTVIYQTDGGVDNASGPWTVTIDALVGGDTRLLGPWVLEFTGP